MLQTRFADAASYGTNLLVNGNAEAGANSPSGAPVSVPGWTTSSAFTVVPYGASGGFPQVTDPGPSDRDVQFFAGGDAAAASATQDIDISGNATDINTGLVRYDLTGWLGGYLTDGDSAQVAVSFLDASNNLLGTAVIGPVTPSDRNNQTSLLYRQSKGLVPINTTRVHVALTMTRFAGTFDDGYADSLALILSLPSALEVTNLNDGGAGSLRAAIAGAFPGDSITFATNVSGTIALTGGELVVADTLNIEGPGAGVLTVSGKNASRVFHFTSVNAATNVVTGLTIANGQASGSDVTGLGGGIYQENGTYLTFVDCVICSNNAAAGGGGLCESYGTVTLSNCLVSRNTSAQLGGGIYHESGTLVVAGSTISSNAASRGGGVALGAYDWFLNSTIAANHASVSGGGLYGLASFVGLTNCTVAANTASSPGCGIYFNGEMVGTATIGNTIVAGNNASSGEADCFGAFTSSGFNFIGVTNGSSGWTGPGDLLGETGAPLDPMLTGLQDNGGPTLTMAPLLMSPVIDQGSSFGITTDQRGMLRPYDDPSIPNAAGGDGSDIGACEAGPRNFQVVSTNDSGPGSLRQVLQAANSTGDSAIITFAPTVAGTIYLTSGELPIDANLSIMGPGANVLTIAGDGASSILDLGFGLVAVSGLTLSQGGNPAVNNSADLSLTGCAITLGAGVGVESDGESLTLENCTFLQNADSGLALFGGGAWITNCTFVYNAGETYGGGIDNQGNLVVRDSTIAYNSALNGGGGIYNAGTCDIGDTIVAQNSAPNVAPMGQDVLGAFNSSGYNLIGMGDGSTGFANGVEQDLVGSSDSPLDPKFSLPLDYSGPTPTLDLAPGSPAIDQGNAFGSTADQRGRVRPFDDPAIPNATGGDGSDIGAVEQGAPLVCVACGPALAVDASQAVRIADARWFGINAAVWDGVFDTPATLSDLSELGCRVLRYPGGSIADEYHWATNLSSDGSYVWPTAYTNFGHIATNLGAQAFITVNYGTGTTNEAACWVRAANATNQFGFKYWEIGNECYGPWETDSNTNAPYTDHDPWTYAMRFKDYYSAMKAADSSIRVGMVAVPGEDAFVNNFNHPAVNPRTGQTHYGWTPVVLATLKTLGVTPDFLVHHFYPESGSDDDAFLLQAAVNWTADASSLRQEIADYFGPGGASIEVVCTENNADSGPEGRQSTSLVNALYLEDSLGQIMKTEFNSFLWWDLRNGADTSGDFSPALYGWRANGDFGVLSGTDDRYPVYYAMKLMQHLAGPGDTVLAATSTNALLSVYSALRGDGTLTLLAINKDPVNTIASQVTVANFASWPTVTVRSYGIPQDEAARTNGPVTAQDIEVANFVSPSDGFNYSFPPYSLTLFTFASSASAPIAAQLTPLSASSGQFVFQLTGQPYVPYVVQNSTNLQTWTPAQTNVLIDGVINITNAISPGTGRQFWRAVWQP